jgi:foldase protein PrsA
MKKIISLLTILLILVGCSLNSSTQISDKDDVLFKIEDTSVTKGEVYNMLRYQQVGQIIINDAQNMLVESKVELTDEIRAEAQAMLEESKEQFGDYFEAYYGRGDDEELLETVFIPAVRQRKLLENYFEDNKDTIISEADPVKLNILYYDSQETAQNAIDLLNDGKSIADVLDELGTTSNHGVSREEPTVIAKNKLDDVVVRFIESEEGLLENFTKSPLMDVTEAKFYVVKLIEDDNEALTEEYKEVFLADQEAGSKVIVDLFKAANFEVYDQAIYDGIKANEQLSDFFPNN